jgi:thioredoxin-related protein
MQNPSQKREEQEFSLILGNSRVIVIFKLFVEYFMVESRVGTAADCGFNRRFHEVVSQLRRWKEIMSAQRYRVVFEGEILDGFQVEEVKRGLAALFKTSEAQTERFFSGKRLAIKKDVDRETAIKYLQAFERAGAVCRMEALETHSSLEQPLRLEREAEKPKRHDVMVCPQCHFEQAPAEDCIRCGIIINKFYQRSHGPENSTDSRWLGQEPRGSKPSSDLSATSAQVGRVRRWVVSSIVLVVLFLAASAFIDYKDSTGGTRIGKISFYTDYDRGLDQAQEAGKPIMLVFSASWCGACKIMKREVFSNDAVADATKQLVNIYIDVDKADRKLINDYKIRYVPSVFFLDYSGETIIQVADRRSPDDFIENMDYMVQEYSYTQEK